MQLYSKIYILCFSTLLLFSGCGEEVDLDGLKNEINNSNVLILEGKKVDTAYMFVPYIDPGAIVNKYIDGAITCPENIIWANVSGSVNTNIPGVYTINYSGTDSLGNTLPPLSRTVHVVENSSNFLSGVYKVACSCTVVVGTNKPVVTTENYTAVVNPANGMGHFQLIPLNIGSEQVIPQASISGSAIGVGYFSANYHYPNSTASGTLSPTKNTFTIETNFQRYSPAANYICKNVYTKLLTIKTNTVE
ncbi:MAG: DUF5011 domain-containing protein [Bacteroidota bacterium]|nr:DUF5011 domain-containing protein [Bacteroidota bacterium]